MLVVLLLALSCVSALDLFPAVYNVTEDNISPEGIEYVPDDNKFVIGSTTNGTVRSITPNGTISILVSDTRISTGTYGIQYFKGNIYIVTTNSSALPTRGGTYSPGNVQAALTVANATTGAITRFVDLTPFGNASNMWANDLTVASDGQVFITDPAGSQVWRVDTNNFVQNYPDPLFRLNQTGLSVNGITPVSNYLVTCATGSGIIYKLQRQSSLLVSLVANLRLPGCDGIRVTNKSPPTLVFSTRNTIYEVASMDNFESAYVVQSVNTTYSAVSTSALVPNNNQQIVYSLNRRTVAPYPIERTLTVENAVNPTPSPSVVPSVCPTVTPTPSASCVATASPSCGCDRDAGVTINFYFADILRGL